MFDSFKLSAGLIAISAILSVIGLVWLSIAMVEGLALIAGSAVASVIVGCAFLLVPVTILGVDLIMKRSAAIVPPKPDADAHPDVVAAVSRIAEGMAEQTPLLALGFAMLAGVASVSFPAALTPILIRLTDARKPAN